MYVKKFSKQITKSLIVLQRAQMIVLVQKPAISEKELLEVNLWYK